MPDNLRIDIDKILISDFSFFLHHEIHSESLILSIKEIGVINPPVVQRISSNFRIICGFRRIYAACMNGITELDCRVMEPGTREQDLLLISLNLATHPLHPLEKSIAIEKLELFFNREEIIGKYLPLLGLNEKCYDEVACLVHLEDRIKNSLYQGDLAQPVASRLYRLDQQDRTAVFDLLDKVHLSVSKQKEVTQNLIEISLREHLNLYDLVNSEPITKTIVNNKLSRPQKGERIRCILRKRRFPEITGAEEKFLKIQRSLRLKEGIKLIPSPYFESDTFRVQLEVNSVKDLERKISLLGKTLDKPDWQELFEL